MCETEVAAETEVTEAVEVNESEMNNLDKLNHLLATDKNLNLPAHRRVIDRSGRNLAWIRKNIYKRNEVDCRIDTLLNLPDVELFAH